MKAGDGVASKQVFDLSDGLSPVITRNTTQTVNTWQRVSQKALQAPATQCLSHPARQPPLPPCLPPLQAFTHQQCSTRLKGKWGKNRAKEKSWKKSFREKIWRKRMRNLWWWTSIVARLQSDEDLMVMWSDAALGCCCSWDSQSNWCRSLMME